MASRCKFHPGSELVFVCTECENKLICPICVADGHNGHKVKLLLQYIPKQKKKIEHCMDNLSKTDFTKLTRKLQDLDTQLEENKTHFDLLRCSIKRQGKALKTAVDNAASKCHKVNDDMEMKNVGVLSTYRTELSKYVGEDKKDKLARCHRIMTSGTDEEVMLLVEGRGANSILPPTRGTLTNVNFNARTSYHMSLRQQFGSLTVDGKEKYID